MQTATVGGSKVVASLLSSDAWETLTREQQQAHANHGTVITDPFGRGIPMYCKRMSTTGLQFFSLYSTHDVPPELAHEFQMNESPEHAITKAFIKSLADTFGNETSIDGGPTPIWYGCHADCEVPITLSDGRRRIADSVIYFPDDMHRKPLVIEVQLSNQQQADFRERSRDYRLAGYDCLWLDGNLSPAQCTDPVDPVAELDEDDQYSLHALTPFSHDLLEDSRWDGVMPTDGVLRFPFRIDMQSHTFAVWYDHAWRDLDIWLHDIISRMMKRSDRPHYTYLRLYSTRRCDECDEPQRIWLNEAMCAEIEEQTAGDCMFKNRLSAEEKSTIAGFYHGASQRKYETLVFTEDGRLRCGSCGRTLGRKTLWVTVIRGHPKVSIPVPLPGNRKQHGWSADRPWEDHSPTVETIDGNPRFVGTNIVTMGHALDDSLQHPALGMIPLNLFIRRRLGWRPNPHVPVKDSIDFDNWMKPVDVERAEYVFEQIESREEELEDDPAIAYSWYDCEDGNFQIDRIRTDSLPDADQ
ncbi:hypothetical protein [uncultured Bifidobacterium sp.]|uniref:hypothetical protein n=1 Tax=uncultured Bifidobacterium sp. TaxID=165187 RepID=UPI00258307AE|nr:hypothetical protein [uncultured Bifidobacterium sp.]